MLKKITKQKKNKRNKKYSQPCRFKLIIRGLGILGLIGIVNIAFIMVYDGFMQWDYFNAKGIQIEGNQRLVRQEVLDQAQIDIGQNILAMNLKLMRKKLLAHPWIAQAEIYREIPGNIVIRIEEHKPLAILDIGKKFLISRTGMIFKSFELSDPQDLPVISGLSITDVDPEMNLTGQVFQAAFEVLERGMSPGCILTNKMIKEIKVDRDIGLTLLAFEKPLAIKIGFSDYAQKYDHFKEIWNFLNRENRFLQIESIDLKDVKRAVIRGISPEKGKEVS